jgi:hypothetical protein
VADPTPLLPDAARDAIRIAIWALFVIYMAPLVIGLLAYFATGHFASASGSTLAGMFVGFAISGDESFSMLHRAILPLMGGFAPLAFLDAKEGSKTLPLMLLLLVAIGLTVLLSAAFSAPDVKTNLGGQTELLGTLSIDDVMARIQSFFNRSQEVLSMYLLMLFGLTLAAKK